MENKDIIFEQFNKAAETVEPKTFLGMDSVWARVEEKLDAENTTIELKKKSNNWRKIAVAASLLLCFSVGYQFLKNDKTIVKPENSVVANDENSLKVKPAVDEYIKKIEAKSELEVKPTEAVAYNDNFSVGAMPSPVGDQASAPAAPVQNYIIEEEVPTANDGYFEDKKVLNSDNDSRNDKKVSGRMETKIYEARGVQYAPQETPVKSTNQIAKKKLNPLVVIDGEAVANNKNKDAKDDLDRNNIENIEYLKEPLYIINGIQYSENEVFGEKPTSPYSPLEKQEITKTKIYQGEEATDLYGDKGKNGVVVITTKNGKPFGK